MFEDVKKFVALKPRTATAVALGLMLGLSGGLASAETLSVSARATGADAVLQKSDRETFVIPEDRLAVTLGTPQGAEEDGSYAIWVGEVERNGRKIVWVELIDDHGEVIYDSEVSQNETHLLPDGRAVVVRALGDDETSGVKVAKADQSRVAPDARLVVTRRVVDDPSLQTAIEFIEQSPREEQGTMMRIATFGQAIWASIVASLTAAADGVLVAWDWITEPFRA